MAEGDCTILNNLKEQFFRKTIDFVNDTLKVALYSVALNSPDGADVAYSATNEISGSGYTAGGETLGTKSITQDDTNDCAVFDAADVQWSSLASNTIQEARLYDDTTATKWVLALWAISTNSNGGNYTIQWHADGILKVS